MATSEVGATSEMDIITATAVGLRSTKCLELLGETEPPEFASVALVVLLATECLVSLSDVLSLAGAAVGNVQSQNDNRSKLPLLLMQTDQHRRRNNNNKSHAWY